MNLLWMAVVGAIIGVVASMFVRGSRSGGLGWTVFLGAGGYLLGGFLAESLEQSVLMQWVFGIVLGAFLLTGYVMMTGERE